MEEMSYEGVVTHDHMIHLSSIGIDNYSDQVLDTLISSGSNTTFCSSEGGMVRCLLWLLNNYLQRIQYRSSTPVIPSCAITSVLRMHTYTIHLLFF